MSADSWSVCPRCDDKIKKEYKKASDEIENSYGKVSLEEYRNLVDKLKNIKKVEECGNNLREDYELGIKLSGLFYVNYSGYCTVCGFVFNYEYEQLLDLEK